MEKDTILKITAVYPSKLLIEVLNPDTSIPRFIELNESKVSEFMQHLKDLISNH